MVRRQDFYDYYLSYPFPPRHLQSAVQLVSAIATKCVNTIPRSLRPNPLAVFADTAASLETASRCLEAYVSILHSSKRPKFELRNHYVEDKPGSGALLWLFQTDGHDKMGLLLANEPRHGPVYVSKELVLSGNEPLAVFSKV